MSERPRPIATVLVASLSRHWLLAITLLAAAGGLSIGSFAAWARHASDPTRYVQLLEALPVPASWRLARTETSSPDCAPFIGSCPAAYAYYRVVGSPTVALTETRTLAAAAGFAVDQEIGGPRCDLPLGGAACIVWMTRDHDAVSASIFDRDFNGVTIEDAGSIVFLQAVDVSRLPGH